MKLVKILIRLASSKAKIRTTYSLTIIARSDSWHNFKKNQFAHYAKANRMDFRANNFILSWMTIENLQIEKF